MIDLTNFKMIYKDRVYQCLAMVHCVEQSEDNKVKPIWLEVTYINSENRIDVVRDNVSMFQFVTK